ncbi:Zinc finger protein 407 [Lucilia cuprina]|nr:Zinc finger protein 407 [Lucilia cuprina]
MYKNIPQMDHDLDDTHLCIKCSRTIVGLENYIQHRKQKCSIPTTSTPQQTTKIAITTTATTPQQQQPTPVTTTIAQVTPEVNYEPFNFNEPANPPSHGGKTSKALGESYELPYELEADVFFSSLQLQSVQSSVPSTSGGKAGSTHTHAGPFTRQKSLQQDTPTVAAVEPTWINPQPPEPPPESNEHFLKAVNDMGESKKSFETIFKPITFEHESPEVSEEEEEEEVDVDMDDDDDDYDPMVETHGSGGKWKLPLMRQSPPVVPVSHTGGKWKPEHRPNLRVAHSQLSRLSPNWDDHMDDMDAQEGQHPPSDHTKGKWVPGTKLQRLEYKEEVVELAKCSNTIQDYWCNICCRKLKSKTIYENHLKSSYHLKRSEPELQLEKAAIAELPRADIKKSFSIMEFKPLSITLAMNSKQRKRRSTYLKCSLCKHVMVRHLIGKHLISHYHYRRMQLHPGISLHMILENIHAIVLQSPFQCRPCRFYTNTEETFLLHWNSASHFDASEGPGRFWCSYCQFECEDNNQMRRHLLGPEHKEVLLAINRSVPVCISKRLSIDCPKCGQKFRFNFELRRHFLIAHPSLDFMGSASDSYQSKFRCAACPEVLPSKIALQRHEKYKHLVSKYFCSICSLEFNSPCKARRHRKTLEHKQKALALNQERLKEEEIKELFNLKIEKRPEQYMRKTVKLEIALLDESPSTSEQATTKASLSLTTSNKESDQLHNSQHICILCSKSFASAQELGRHSRVCKPITMVSTEEIKQVSQLTQTITEKGEKIWSCDLCEFKAPFQSELLYHRVFHSYTNVAKNQLLPCPLCEKSFRKQSLRFHLHNHTKEKLFKCDQCDAAFSRPNNLKDHIRNIHGDGVRSSKKTPTIAENDVSLPVKVEKVFPCNECSKVFKSKHSMKMHHLTHHVSEERPLFKCSHMNCEYSTVSKSFLTTHMKSHSMESIKCTEKNCNYVGKSKLHLKRHLQSHKPSSEAKHFNCDKCSFKTKIKGHLKRHMRHHTGEKPYSCPHCDFRTSTWENVRKHVLKTEKHAGKFVFECKKCKKDLEANVEGEKEGENQIKEIFKTNSHQEYQQHLKQQHKNDK